MKNYYGLRQTFPTFLAALGLSTGAMAQASLQTSPYNQDFNTLANTGTSGTLPTGWYISEANAGNGTTADATYAANNGAASAGNTYSFGANDGTERALGTLLSGSLTPTIGGAFTNNTAAPLTSLAIAYTGETWRIGGTGRADRLDFQYSLDATSLTDSKATWNNVDALDYTNTAVATAVTAGVTTPIQTANVSSTITGINIPVGATIWIRWNDFNASGADDGMAVDDFSISWQGGAATSPVLTVPSAPLVFATQTINTTSPAQSYQLSATNLTADVTVTAPAGFTVSKDNATFSTTLTYTPAELATAQTVYVRFTSATAGTISGVITHTTTGGATQGVNVSGVSYDPAKLAFDFENCSNSLPDGWTQANVLGAQIWGCTTFGHDVADATGKLSKGNALQISGFSGGSIPNEDWLISPPFNTSAFTFPLFSFWSRTAFAGATLQMKVSTNYSGSGSPTAAGVTWTDVYGAFPRPASDTWTLTDNVDLSAFKGQKVYVAFVYISSSTEAPRWTLDDVQLRDATAAPAPTVAASATTLDFGYQAENTTSTRTFDVSLRNLSADATITSSSSTFQVSKDGNAFSNSVSFTPAEASNSSKTVTVRFAPTQASQAYAGTLTVASAGATSATVGLTGNSYSTANTLEVVNWNMEWFGSKESGMGPNDKNLQQENAKKILTSLNADIFALAEVVDTVRLGTMIRQIGGYRYSVSSAASYGQTAAEFDKAQKLVFVYRPTVIKNPTFKVLLECPNQATDCESYNSWSSGRFPYAMEADVTLEGAPTSRVTFVLIHAKANTAPVVTSYERRKKGAEDLKKELDANYATKNVVILGDFNDDLDQTITAGITPAVSSYQAFVDDNANYKALTLPLSQAGQKSTVSYNDIIDHVVVSNEMASRYLPNSTEIMVSATAPISNYANTTSDHYPVQTRYTFSTITSTKQQVRRAEQLVISPNPAREVLTVQLPAQTGEFSLQVTAADGRVVFTGTGRAEQLNQQLNQRFGGLKAGLYVVRATSAQNTYIGRFVKQ